MPPPDLIGKRASCPLLHTSPATRRPGPLGHFGTRWRYSYSLHRKDPPRMRCYLALLALLGAALLLTACGAPPAPPTLVGVVVTQPPTTPAPPQPPALSANQQIFATATAQKAARLGLPSVTPL